MKPSGNRAAITAQWSSQLWHLDIQIQMLHWSCIKRDQQHFLCPPCIRASNFSHCSAELRKAAHPSIASLTAVDQRDPCCFFSGDITVSRLSISANKSCPRHRCSRGRWPQAVAQSDANAAGKSSDFRRRKAKWVCPPFLFDIISFPNPLTPKDDWIL